MTSIIKFSVCFFALLLLNSCIINNPQPEDCVVKEITVSEIIEGSSYDIKLYDGKSDYYYINRGLENGLTMQQMNDQVLGKKVNLHVYKFWFGVESEHVSQLSMGDQIIFSEF